MLEIASVLTDVVSRTPVDGGCTASTSSVGSTGSSAGGVGSLEGASLLPRAIRDRSAFCLAALRSVALLSTSKLILGL